MPAPRSSSIGSVSSRSPCWRTTRYAYAPAGPVVVPSGWAISQYSSSLLTSTCWPWAGSTDGSTATRVRMPLPAAVQAVHPLSMRWSVSGTPAGAPRIPMSSPISWSSMVSCEISIGSTSGPRISVADVMLMTGRSSISLESSGTITYA